MKVIEQIDATGVAHADPLLAGTHTEGFEEVTLSCAARAGDHQIVVATHKVEASELKHQRLVEAGLEVPLEDFQDLAFNKPALFDTARNALLELVPGLEPKDVLKKRSCSGALARRPLEPWVEFLKRAG